MCMPFDQAHSDFVGRRAGDEGTTVVGNLEKFGLVVEEEVAPCEEFTTKKLLLLTPKPCSEEEEAEFFRLEESCCRKHFRQPSRGLRGCGWSDANVISE
jgi:hypothetical protein